MRIVNKYKTFFVLGTKIKRFPVRILKFNRPKWLLIKKIILRDIKKRVVQTNIRRKNKYDQEKQLPINLFFNKSSESFWGRLKKNHKTSLFAKKNWLNSYDNNIKESLIKRMLQKKDKKIDYLNLFFLFFEFRIDLLLWNLNYFSTSYEACVQIKNGFVLVNGLIADCNTYLKEGDIITFLNTNAVLEKNFLRYNINHKIYTSFVEIDYYTNTIIILKSYNCNNTADLALLSTEYIDSKLLKNNMKL